MLRRACRAPCRSCRSAPGQQLQRRLRSSRPPWRTSANTALEASTSWAICLSLAPSASISEPEVVDRVRDVVVATSEFARRSRGRSARGGSKRLSVADERRAVVVEAFAGPRQQLLQVGARFGVEAGEEFVEVDVRRGLRAAGALRRSCSLPGRRRARVDLDGDVLQLGLRAHQQRRVAVDARVLRRHFHRHVATPWCRSTLATSPIFAPAIVTAWPWPGVTRLGGLELGLQRVVVVAEHRHPAREVEVLVREDVAADGGRDHDHRRPPR